MNIFVFYQHRFALCSIAIINLSEIDEWFTVGSTALEIDLFVGALRWLYSM